MSGDRLQDWMLRQPRDRLAAAEVDAVFHEIDRHVVRRYERERCLRPMPRSLGQMAWSIVTGLALGVAAFRVTTWLLGFTESLLARAGAGMAAVAGVEAAGSPTRWPCQARAFQIVVALYGHTRLVVARVYLVA